MCGVKEIIEKIRELEKEDKKEVIRDIKSQKLTLSRCVKLLKKNEKNFRFFYPMGVMSIFVTHFRGGFLTFLTFFIVNFEFNR